MDSEEAPKSSKKDDGNVRVPRAKRRRHEPIKVSNQISTRRRKEIERALEEPSSTPKSWSRANGWKSHRIGRKIVRRGKSGQIEYDMMDL